MMIVKIRILFSFKLSLFYFLRCQSYFFCLDSNCFCFISCDALIQVVLFLLSGNNERKFCLGSGLILALAKRNKSALVLV